MGIRGLGRQGDQGTAALIERMPAGGGLASGVATALPEQGDKYARADSVRGREAKVTPGASGQIDRSPVPDRSGAAIRELVRVVPSYTGAASTIANIEPIPSSVGGGVALGKDVRVCGESVEIASPGWVPPVVDGKPGTDVLDWFNPALIRDWVEHSHIATTSTLGHLTPGCSSRAVLRSAGGERDEEVVGYDSMPGRGRAPNETFPCRIDVVGALADHAGGEWIGGGCRKLRDHRDEDQKHANHRESRIASDKTRSAVRHGQPQSHRAIGTLTIFAA
jgi:hypothetical protein